MKIRKVLSTTGKILGTVAVGGTGLVFGAFEMGASSMSGEASESFGKVREGCFDTVKKMWDPTATSKDLSESFSSTLQSASDMGGAFDNLVDVQNERIEEYLNDPEKMKKILEQNGIDPSIADDPEKLNRLLEKAKKRKEAKEKY